MSHYFASDVHLRHDRPDRALRFAAWVDTLDRKDSLLIVGDLCDFWMGSRSDDRALMQCEGMRSLSAFRGRGGELAIMAGNHDNWLCPSYERLLGAAIVSEPLERTIHGSRLHLVHGHLLGARKKWKALMESRQFFEAFGLLPDPVATRLDRILDAKNRRGLLDDEERHLAIYRPYAAGLADRADIVVIGHVHRPVDEAGPPRLIVLGGWQDRSCYLKIDPSGAVSHVVCPLPDAAEHARDTATCASVEYE